MTDWQLPLSNRVDVAVGQAADVVLPREPARVADECELVVLAFRPQRPNDGARRAADLGDLVHRSARDEQVAVQVAFDGVAVHVVDERVGERLHARVGVGDLEVIPASPLEHERSWPGRSPGRDQAHHLAASGRPPGTSAVHAHGLHVVGQEQCVIVRQHLQVVHVGGVAVSGAEAVHDRVRACRAPQNVLFAPK